MKKLFTIESVYKLPIVPVIFLLVLTAAAQNANPPAPLPIQIGDKNGQGPPVKVNYLNVCNPSDEELKEIKTALDKVPAKANISPDFEVSRGRTSMQDAVPARYVRLRRELSGDAFFSNVQYSISTNEAITVETLVLKVKDPKVLVSLSFEDNVSSSASAPTVMLDVNTPASRIKLERFGKSNVVLTRCEGADQSAYEPLFQRASTLFAGYRKALGLRNMFRMDLNWLVQAPQPAKTKK